MHSIFFFLEHTSIAELSSSTYFQKYVLENSNILQHLVWNSLNIIRQKFQKPIGMEKQLTVLYINHSI